MVLYTGEILALLKAQICTICFQTSIQIFGIHKAPIHIRRYKLSRLRLSKPYACVKSSICTCKGTLYKLNIFSVYFLLITRIPEN